LTSADEGIERHRYAYLEMVLKRDLVTVKR
jgi:hypothetical protein